MVETAEEASQAVSFTRFPPDGVRGFAAASRSSQFGRIKDYHRRAHEEICLLVQVESALGLENLEAICAVPGVDGVFVGPGDLSAALGYLGDQGNSQMVELIEGAVRRIVAAGDRAGILTGDESSGPALYRGWMRLHRGWQRYCGSGTRFRSAFGTIQDVRA